MKTTWVVSVVVCAVTIMSACTKSPTTPTDNEPHYGSVAVITNPPGLTFRLEREAYYDTSFVSPDTVEQVLIGKCRVCIESYAQGYFSWCHSIQVAEGQVSTLDLDLSATVSLHSLPSGARVSVDDVPTGTVTPCQLALLGSIHFLRCELAGYYPASCFVSLDVGVSQDITLTLPDLAPDRHMVLAVGQEVYQEGGENIYVVGFDGQRRKLVSDYDQYGSEVILSPDRQYLTYSTRNSQQVIRLDGTGKRTIPHTGIMTEDYSWSHSNRYIIFGVYTDGIYRYDTQQRQTIELYNTSGFTADHNPVYSPDDKHIVFIHHEYGVEAWLWLMNADGTHARPITPVFATLHDEFLRLRWLSDSLIAFEAREDGQRVVYTVRLRADGGLVNPEPVFLCPDGAGELSFSPDNTHFAYAQRFASSQQSTIWCGTVLDWHAEPIYSDSSTIGEMYWSPQNDGLACIEFYRQYDDNSNHYFIRRSALWVPIGGSAHRIIEYSDYSGSWPVAGIPIE